MKEFARPGEPCRGSGIGCMLAACLLFPPFWIILPFLLIHSLTRKPCRPVDSTHTPV